MGLSPKLPIAFLKTRKNGDKSRGKSLTDRLFTGMKFAPINGHFEAYSGLKGGSMSALALWVCRWVVDPAYGFSE